MRDDLNKLLCEHERYHSSDKFSNYRHRKSFKHEDEDGEIGGRESMQTRYRQDGFQKEFSENLNPLWGIIRKSVGKKWDNFYSELCKKFNMRSVINDHILQHLYQKVEVNTFFKNGEIWVKPKYNKIQPLNGYHCEYYVDPRDGIIKANKHYKSYKKGYEERKKQRELDLMKVKRVIDKDNVLHLIDGVWYHFTLEDVPKGEVVYACPGDRHTLKFKPNLWSNKEKSWDEMSITEQARFGVPRLVGNFAKDLLTGELMVSKVGTNFGRHKYIESQRYHATKQTASHKLLKKAGIAGIAGI
jgi:hypothetical protein